MPARKRHPATRPPADARPAADATRVVPGGAPEGTAAGAIANSLSERAYPFPGDYGDTPEERHQNFSRDNITGAAHARPLHGANPPAPVPLGNVPAARGMLSDPREADNIVFDRGDTTPPLIDRHKDLWGRREADPEYGIDPASDPHPSSASMPRLRPRQGHANDTATGELDPYVDDRLEGEQAQLRVNAMRPVPAVPGAQRDATAARPPHMPPPRTGDVDLAQPGTPNELSKAIGTNQPGHGPAEDHSADHSKEIEAAIDEAADHMKLSMAHRAKGIVRRGPYRGSPGEP